MPTDNDTLKEALRNILWLYNRRAHLVSHIGADGVGKLTGAYEREIARLWTAVARVRAQEQVNRRADDTRPGYVSIAVGAGEIHVPFHLVPALPESAVLAEALELARKICLGGPTAAICLSGSTLLLGDIARVGDVDFCEYIKQIPDAATARRAFEALIARSSQQHFVIGIRLREQLTAPKFHTYDISNRTGTLDEKTVTTIAAAMATARNGKASFLTQTNFAGVIDATNWLIFHGDTLEGDPAAGMSFASQEASLGIWAGRPLHLFDSLGAYLSFLRGEVSRYAEKDPIKAIKRAIPLLRLFGEADLVDELVHHARNARAFSAAAAQARIELHERYAGKPAFGTLCDALHKDCEALAAEALGELVAWDQITSRLEAALQAFAAALQTTPGGPIWDRVLAVAASD